MFDNYAAYRRAAKPDDPCALCAAGTLREFKYWKVVENLFPYDMVADRHDMILPLRHTNGDDITQEELEELEYLKKNVLTDDYGLIMQALPNTVSIPGHIHYHLIKVKNLGG